MVELYDWGWTWITHPVGLQKFNSCTYHLGLRVKREKEVLRSRDNVFSAVKEISLVLFSFFCAYFLSVTRRVCLLFGSGIKLDTSLIIFH